MKKILLAALLLASLCACAAPATEPPTTEPPRRAAVGIDLTLDAATPIGEATAVADELRARLATAYPGVDFTIAVNGAPALEQNDTIAVPVKGVITDANREILLTQAAAQVGAQLKKWGYQGTAVTTQPATTATSTATNAPSITQKPTTTTTEKPTAKPAEVPKTWANPHVDSIVPQGVGEFGRTFDYDRFADSPSFAITNNQGKQLIIKLRRADPNKPEESFADIYTDENGDDIWEWRQALPGRVSSDEQLGVWEGMFQVLLDSNYSSQSSTGANIPIIDIYWIKEDNRAQIEGGLVKKLSDSDYQRLQNAGSGLHVFQGVNDSTPAIYYK